MSNTIFSEQRKGRILNRRTLLAVITLSEAALVLGALYQ